MELRKYLEENVLLFDGGMGTYFAQKNHCSGSGCELVNINQPEIISDIHREYIEAGAAAIKTNTFGANRLALSGDEELVKKVIAAGWKLANDAAENFIAGDGKAESDRAGVGSAENDHIPYVFADIGPVIADTAKEQETEYCWVIDRFLELGARNFLFETNADAEGLTAAVKYLRSKCADAYIIVSFAVQPDGFSREGKFVTELIRTITQTGAADAVGMNCVCGARHMLELVQKLKLGEKITSSKAVISDDMPVHRVQADCLANAGSVHAGRAEECNKNNSLLTNNCMQLAVMPNAGYPTVIGNRTFYEGDPVYFASQLIEMMHMGARIVGGCCGTTPAHIACVRQLIRENFQPETQTHVSTEAGEYEAASIRLNQNSDISATAAEQDQKTSVQSESKFWDNIKNGKKVIAVELDPPADADLTKFMNGAQQLKQANVDIITIADCPIARARVDSSLLACKVHRELNMEALPHMTCRDRNLNATKALLLGLYAEGLRNALLVTGDPIPSAQRDEVKSVFQFNSRKLAAFATSLSEQELPSPIHVFGALNVNAYNFDNQLKMAREKLNNGMVGFLTQPVLTEAALENLKIAHRELPEAYIMGGIIPVVSAKNARFMDSEIHGINVDPRITEMYEGKDREEGEELAVKISSVIAQEIAPYVSGFYLMTPFMRTGLICRIIDKIRDAGLTDN